MVCSKVCIGGTTILFGAYLLACVAIPATALWYALGDARLVSTTLAIGFCFAFTSFGAILGLNLRLPIGKLPLGASGVAD